MLPNSRRWRRNWRQFKETTDYGGQVCWMPGRILCPKTPAPRFTLTALPGVSTPAFSIASNTCPSLEELGRGCYLTFTRMDGWDVSNPLADRLIPSRRVRVMCSVPALIFLQALRYIGWGAKFRPQTDAQCR